MNIYDLITEEVSTNFSEGLNGYSSDDIREIAFSSTVDMLQSGFSEDDAVELGLASAITFCNCDDALLEMFNEIYCAEEDAEVTFSAEEVDDILDTYSNIQSVYTGDTPTLYEVVMDGLFSEELNREEYLSSSLFSEALEVIETTPIPSSVDGELEVATTESRLRPAHRDEMELPAKKAKVLSDLTSDTLGKVLEPEERVTTETQVLDQKAKIQDSLLDTELSDHARVSLDEEFDKVQTQKVIEESIKEPEPNIEKFNEELETITDEYFAAIAPGGFDARADRDKKKIAALEKELFDTKDELDKRSDTRVLGGFGAGYFKTKDNDNTQVGILGSGRDARASIMRTKMDYMTKKTPNAKFSKLITMTAKDAIVEGILTGVTYQVMDIGIKASSGIIRSGYEALLRLTKPTFKNIGEKLANAGSSFANWLIPGGPSASEIIDGMSDQDTTTIIKALDKSNWVANMNDATRTKFLANLSRTGAMYIDEKGTLKQRNLVDQLLNAYDESPDRFLEDLPGKLAEIKELYKSTSLVSQDSINTDSIYNKLKTATSRDQVRSVLVDEFNLMKKPLISLKELSLALSNDFIALMTSDRRFYNSVLDTIARDIERNMRSTGGDSILEVAQTFIRNLRLCANEGDIRRVTDRLLVANVRIINAMLDATPDNAFAAELDIPGANANMDNSPILSSHGSSVGPEHIGQAGGWSDEEIETSLALKETDSARKLKDADKVTEEGATSTFSASVLSSTDGYATKAGFGPDAV